MNERTSLQDLRQFLFDHVCTYDELEVLLLLQGRPELDWTVKTAAESRGLSTDACQQALEALAARSLLAIRGSGTFRYAPASKALAACTRELQRVYLDDRFAIIQLMTTNAMDRVRAAALGRLGDALQLRDLKKPRCSTTPSESYGKTCRRLAKAATSSTVARPHGVGSGMSRQSNDGLNPLGGVA